MPERMKIGNVVVEYDPVATRDAYARIDGGINSCKCEYCANYRLVREVIYPHDFLATLERLGIDYRKEIELTHLPADDADDDGPAYAQAALGHFAFVGRVIENNPEPTQSEPPTVFDYAVADGEQVHPVTRATFNGSPDFIDLEFWVPSVPKAPASD